MENKFDEEKVKEIAKSYLATARAGDLEHALKAVEWVKELGQGRADINLLITAVYLHDIGWSGIAPKGKLVVEEVLKLENKANKNSKKFITEALNKLNFDNSEIKTVVRLVAAADKHQSEKDDEEIIVDADNLSKLNIEHLQRKFRPEAYKKLVGMFKKEFISRIKTRKGKELFPKLLADLERKLIENK